MSVYVMIFTKGKMYRGFIISYGGSFEISWHSGVDFEARIHYRESFIMSNLVTMYLIVFDTNLFKSTLDSIDSPSNLTKKHTLHTTSIFALHKARIQLW